MRSSRKTKLLRPRKRARLPPQRSETATSESASGKANVARFTAANSDSETEDVGEMIARGSEPRELSNEHLHSLFSGAPDVRFTTTVAGKANVVRDAKTVPSSGGLPSLDSIEALSSTVLASPRVPTNLGDAPAAAATETPRVEREPLTRSVPASKCESPTFTAPAVSPPSPSPSSPSKFDAPRHPLSVEWLNIVKQEASAALQRGVCPAMIEQVTSEFLDRVDERSYGSPGSVTFTTAMIQLRNTLQTRLNDAELRQLPLELVQSAVELALMQPLSQSQMRGCWLRSLLAASLVCCTWRDAVRMLCAMLDHTAGRCTPGCLTPWTARGWQPAHYWLWQLEMHRRRLNEARRSASCLD